MAQSLLPKQSLPEKFLKIFGNKFHIMDENDQLYGFCEQKRFKLKEDLRPAS